MGKLVIVDKKKLKISAEEHEKKLREDKISAKILRELHQQAKDDLKKLQEAQ